MPQSHISLSRSTPKTPILKCKNIDLPNFTKRHATPRSVWVCVALAHAGPGHHDTSKKFLGNFVAGRKRTSKTGIANQKFGIGAGENFISNFVVVLYYVYKHWGGYYMSWMKQKQQKLRDEERELKKELSELKGKKKKWTMNKPFHDDDNDEYQTMEK